MTEYYQDLVLEQSEDTVRLGVYLIESKGTNPPESIHYDIQLVTDIIITIVDLKLESVKQVIDALTNLYKEAKYDSIAT